jgi:hypothetical protein
MRVTRQSASDLDRREQFSGRMIVAPSDDVARVTLEERTMTHAARTNPCTNLGLAALAVLSVAGTSWGQDASNALGTFGLRANAGPLHAVQTESTVGASADLRRFVGSAVDPNGAWEASWDYSADLDPNGNAKLTGAATIINKSGAAIDFDVVFEVPICPFIQNASKMGGACTIKLTTNENGGAISTQGGNAVFTALADGGGGPKLFHGPFNMGSTGSGIAQTANLFGAPFPAMQAAAIGDRFGIRHVFKLTDGDTVLVTSNLIVGGDPANFVECEESETAPAAQAAAAPPPAPALIPTGSNGQTSSAVTLGASASNKVTISGDSGSKRKSTASRNRSSSSASAKKAKAAAPSRSAASSRPTTPSRRPATPYRR